MKRDEVIRKLGTVIKKDVLMRVVQAKAKTQPTNYNLQLLNATFKTTADAYNNWFTALGVLCIFQRALVGTLLAEAVAAGGGMALKKREKEQLIDAIGIGACLSKADAG